MRRFPTPAIHRTNVASAIAACCAALTLCACGGGNSLTGSSLAADSAGNNNNSGGGSGLVSVGSPSTSTNPSNPGGGGDVGQSFEVSLSGLNAGESVSLSMNGGPPEVLTMNAVTIFLDPGFAVAAGAHYTVSIVTQPSGQTCTIANPSGTFVNGYIIPAVTCVDGVSNPSSLSDAAASMKTTAAAAVPATRSGAATWNLNGTEWIFGGTASGGALLSDFWSFDASTHAWTKPIVASAAPDSGGDPSLPAPRTAAATWSDSSGNLWLFGGLGASASGQPVLLNDLWKFNPATGEWLRAPAGAAPASPAPAPRMGAASWVDGGGDLWLFGGTTSAGASDASTPAELWRYSPESQRWTAVSNSR